MAALGPSETPGVAAGGRRVEIVRGALWAVRLDRHRRSAATWPGYVLGEVACGQASELAAAMGVQDGVTLARLRRGARALAARSPQGGIAAWLWVSTGHEFAEPIRRKLMFAPDEAYGWDAGTLPAHRGLGLFTSLLEVAGAAMLREGRTVMWGGIHDHNLASQRANARAGFAPVLRLSALLLGGRSVIRTRAADYADPELVHRARRILGAAAGERRLAVSTAAAGAGREPVGGPRC